MSDHPASPQDPDGRDREEQPDFGKLFEQFLGDSGNPAMAEALRQLGLDQANPAMMGMLAAQLQALFTAAPVDGINRELSEDVARKTVSAAGDAVVTDAETRAVQEAVHVAGLWLDEVTALAAPGAPAYAWSRAEWVTHTMGTWARLVGPVAEGVNGAVSSAMRGQLEQFGEGGMPAMPGIPAGMDLGAMIAQFEPMLGRMSSSMFGAQIGQAVGTLAGDLLSATEVNLPLLDRPAVALLPANIAAFAEGLELDLDQVRLYLALRESARTRLFAAVPWLGPQLLTAVESYAKDIRIDTEGIEAKLSEIDPTDPAAMQQALGSSLFSPDPSPAQLAARTRLETLLALVEGWVDVVADSAARTRLPQASALGEAVRRRRAGGGPAEAVFGELVGLQLRPRRLRDAANLFAALDNAGGAAARDGVWAHPDLAPSAADLDDVLDYVDRVQGRQPASGRGEGPAADATSATAGEGMSELDAALEQILAAADAEDAREAHRAAADEEGPTDGGPWPRHRAKGDEGQPGVGDPGSPSAPGGPGGAGGPGRPGGPGEPPAR